MIYVEAPSRIDTKGDTLFLAGGISGCPDWQHEAVSMLRHTPYIVLNPRRTAFPSGDRVAMSEQVAWEYSGLRAANVVVFWFPPSGLQPIALYELGAVTAMGKPVSVGAHPQYCRRIDLELQLEAAQVSAKVCDTLDDTISRALQLLQEARS
ncbi:MAG: nucleoside 2-deoxyribosyltransferase domain-containing protein [Streptosporangiaceae bacterium]|nr:nucleoside 2-deoxyribosyltransferase domain-containing protein [Streptosporangiaceae bacterium]